MTVSASIRARHQLRREIQLRGTIGCAPDGEPLDHEDLLLRNSSWSLCALKATRTAIENRALAEDPGRQIQLCSGVAA